jgi:lysozyme family protein
MRSTFDKVMPHVFLTEGGYVDHPNDPGGATNLGITFAVLQKWRGHKISKQNVRDLNKPEARLIYKAWYWDKIKLDQMPAGVDWAVFDFSINSGPSRAVKGLQTALNVTSDGVLGPITMSRLATKAPKDIVHGITLYRRAFVRRLRNYPTFKRGWERRITRVHDEASALAGNMVIVTNTRPHKTHKPHELDTPTSTVKAPQVTIFSLLAKLAGFLFRTFFSRK